MEQNTKQVMYLEKPQDFVSHINVVGGYLEHNGKFLFLQYIDTKFQGTWGVPAGKIKVGEDPVNALLREIYEETKIWVTVDEVQLVNKIYFREPYDYIYYMFKVSLPKTLINKVVISAEHQNFAWLDYQEASALPLIFGAKEALEYFIRSTKKLDRHKIVSSVYLILRKGSQYLLYLRCNSGFEDGNYGLVAGHIEYGESAKQAMVREALEEANITIAEEDLHFAHISCRYSDRENIDIFFTCDKWQGNIVNNEPDKCIELKFFNFEQFPTNVIKYIKDVIILTNNNIHYSEIGWQEKVTAREVILDTEVN